MSLKTFKLRYIDGKKNSNATYSINTQDVTQPKQTCWQSETRCTFLANGCVQMLSPSIPRCLVRQLLRAQTSIWQDNFPLIALFGGCCEAVYYPCCSKGAKPIIDAVSRTFLLLHHLTHMALIQPPALASNSGPSRDVTGQHTDSCFYQIGGWRKA